MMYADDTKNWRQMEHHDDHLTLQQDVINLIGWSIRNKMKLHPSKCKVLMVSKLSPPLIDVLPCVQFMYTMGDTLLDYVPSEKYLGITVKMTLNFTEHAYLLYS